MNNTFNHGRFARLYRKHTVEHIKSYLLSIAVLAGILTICLGFLWNEGHQKLNIPNQANVFVFLYLACGTIFTSLAFYNLSEKKKAIPALTLPVSHFENYLVSWIYTFIIYQLVYIGLFFGIDGALFAIGAPYEIMHNEMINIFSLDQKFYIVFIGYIVLHAFAFWGAIYFKNLHFIKTAFTLFAFVILYLLVNELLARILIIPGAHFTLPFAGVSFKEHGQTYYLFVVKGFTFWMAAIVVTTAVLLWATAYFKLKEKEV